MNDTTSQEPRGGCDVCGRPRQTAPDHECKQCERPCKIDEYRRSQPDAADVKLTLTELGIDRRFYDCLPPGLVRRLSRPEARRTIPSSAKVAAWHVLNDRSPVGKHKLFALVDAVACLLVHGGPDSSLETARYAFQTVVPPAAALVAVRTLLGNDKAP